MHPRLTPPHAAPRRLTPPHAATDAELIELALQRGAEVELLLPARANVYAHANLKAGTSTVRLAFVAAPQRAAAASCDGIGKHEAALHTREKGRITSDLMGGRGSYSQRPPTSPISLHFDHRTGGPAASRWRMADAVAAARPPDDARQGPSRVHPSPPPPLLLVQPRAPSRGVISPAPSLTRLPLTARAAPHPPPPPPCPSPRT